MGFALALALGAIFNLAPLVASTLTISSSVDGTSADYATSPFIYYGPKVFPMLTNAPVIFLKSDACNQVNELKGFVVIMLDVFTGCDLGDLAEVYGRLNTAGSLALIRVGMFSRDPGLFSFAHSDWSLSAHTPAAGGLMPFLEIPGVMVGEGTLDRWWKGELKTCTASLTSDHEEGWADLFRSLLWTASMRVALPAFSAAAVAVAAAEAWRRRGALTTGFWICIIQGCSMILVGGELACGGYGPTVLPFHFHYAMWFKLSGMSVFATTLLAVVLREKARALRQLPLIDAYTAYRRRIWFGLVFLLALDVGVALSLSWSHARQQRDSRVVILLICALECWAAAFYIYHSLDLVGTLRGYLENYETSRVPELATAVARLTLLLKVSVLGMALMVMALLGMALLSSLYRKPGAGLDPQQRVGSTMRHLWFFSSVFLFSFSRILISLSQVLIVKPYNAEVVKMPLALRRCARALCCATARPTPEGDGGNHDPKKHDTHTGRRVMPVAASEEYIEDEDRSFDSSVSSKDYFDVPDEQADEKGARRAASTQWEQPHGFDSSRRLLQVEPTGELDLRGSLAPPGYTAPVFMYMVACDSLGRPVRAPIPLGQDYRLHPGGGLGLSGGDWQAPLQPNDPLAAMHTAWNHPYAGFHTGPAPGKFPPDLQHQQHQLHQLHQQHQHFQQFNAQMQTLMIQQQQHYEQCYNQYYDPHENPTHIQSRQHQHPLGMLPPLRVAPRAEEPTSGGGAATAAAPPARPSWESPPDVPVAPLAPAASGGVSVSSFRTDAASIPSLRDGGAPPLTPKRPSSPQLPAQAASVYEPANREASRAALVQSASPQARRKSFPARPVSESAAVGR